MTEADAKKKICPLIGLLAMTTLHASLKAVSLNLGEEQKRNLEEATENVDALCLGSECMMWRWSNQELEDFAEGEGDCGLKRGTSWWRG